MLTNRLTGTTGNGDHRDEHSDSPPRRTRDQPDRTRTPNLLVIPIRPRSGDPLLTRTVVRREGIEPPTR
jgi:hypothetical protein